MNKLQLITKPKTITDVYTNIYRLFSHTEDFNLDCEDMTELKTESGEYAFADDAEAEFVESVIDSCFIFCNKNNLDIYTVQKLVVETALSSK